MRQLKREVKIGNVTIGGNNPIAVQTMLNVPVEDIEGNVAQAKRCEAAGCQILRVTCPSAADAKCIGPTPTTARSARFAAPRLPG